MQSGLYTWFSKSNAYQLKLEKASKYPHGNISKVTYIDSYGNEYKSVKAIAAALDHINLAWATLGWFMRSPGISFVLQVIVDSMGVNLQKDACDIEK